MGSSMLYIVFSIGSTYNRMYDRYEVHPTKAAAEQAIKEYQRESLQSWAEDGENVNAYGDDDTTTDYYCVPVNEKALNVLLEEMNCEIDEKQMVHIFREMEDNAN